MYRRWSACGRLVFFFSSRRRHTRLQGDWSSDVCSSDLRGNANNPGPEIPRQFLQLIQGENRKPFQKGSGRLELAEAIASKDNPLTAQIGRASCRERV